MERIVCELSAGGSDLSWRSIQLRYVIISHHTWMFRKTINRLLLLATKTILGDPMDNFGDPMGNPSGNENHKSIVTFGDPMDNENNLC